MFRFRLPALLISLITLPGIILALAACAGDAGVGSARVPATVKGKVVGANGPISNAIVQVQGTPNQTTSAADGTFTLHGEGLGGTAAVTVTAWAEDHYIGMTMLDPKQGNLNTDKDIEVMIKPLFDRDNHAYTWFGFEGKTGAASCGMCHREFPEWQADAHSQSAKNPRFISVYRGTNVQGAKSQPTRFTTDGNVLPPDPALPDYGPGFKLDNGDRAGTCSTCHTPMAAKTETQNGCAWSGCHTSLTADRAEETGAAGRSIRGVSPVGIFGIGEEGVGCEFCHVVKNVRLDPATQLPFADAPGIHVFGTAPPARRPQGVLRHTHRRESRRGHVLAIAIAKCVLCGVSLRCDGWRGRQHARDRRHGGLQLVWRMARQPV